MKIFLGSDHAGFVLKSKIIDYLKSKNFEVEDKGAFNLDLNDDYPDFIRPVAEAVSKDPEARGIVLGRSGVGEAILANRFPNVRAVSWYGCDFSIIKLSREHNNANVLSLGARSISLNQAIEAVELWLATPFSGDERHVRRIAKLEL